MGEFYLSLCVDVYLPESLCVLRPSIDMNLQFASAHTGVIKGKNWCQRLSSLMVFIFLDLNQNSYDNLNNVLEIV